MFNCSMAKRHDVLEFAVLGVLSDGPLHGYELRKRLRSFELVYRLGGEEFGVLLPETALASALEVSERILLHLREHEFLIDGHRFRVRAGEMIDRHVERGRHHRDRLAGVTMADVGDVEATKAAFARATRVARNSPATTRPWGLTALSIGTQISKSKVSAGTRL